MLHYHGTRFSGPDENHRALTGRHAMVSFVDTDHTAVVAEVCQSFCLDNGAFSAWKAGRPYDFDGYREWAMTWLRHPGCDFAIIPDIIDGSEADNDGLVHQYRGDALDCERWVPVWHLHESISRLQTLANEWPRVALGSSGEYAKIGDSRWWQRMAEALDAITDEDGFPITKLHGLRMLDPGLFSYIPFASADSTNVARNMGLDVRWTGPYVPTRQLTRAIVIMDRIESHACAARWNNEPFIIKQANLDLLDGSRMGAADAELNRGRT